MQQRSHYTTRRSTGRPVYAHGREVGEIRGATLQKHVKQSVHFLHDPAGWAWDDDILDQARQAGVSVCLIVDDETRWKYQAALADFSTYGVPISRGFGSQTCLPLKYWRCKPPRGWKAARKREHAQALAEQEQARKKTTKRNKPDSPQLSFWGKKL